MNDKKLLLKQVFFIPEGNIIIGQVVFVPLYLYDVM